MNRNRHLPLELLLCPALLCAVPSAAGDMDAALGTNFWFMTDAQQVWPFVDFFRQSRPFWSSSSSAWDDGRTLNLDTNGYPLTLASDQGAATLLFWSGGRFPVGDYVLLYDGQGSVVVDFGQGVPISIVSSQPGRIVVRVPAGTEGFRITIAQTTAGNHVRNIRFIAPGFEQTYQTQVFHPLFLERLSEMRCLRFMDWMAANSTNMVAWSERTRPQSQTQAGANGICVELMVELCNRLNADGWFCLPPRGSADCYRQFATYVRDHLKPCLKAYYEYGNEMWNGGVQFNVSYVESLGVAMGYSAGWTAQHHGWARRLVEMQQVVEQVYAGRMNQCVRVIATQLGNCGVVDGLLHYTDGHEPGEDHGDVIAGAPYFNAEGARGSTDINVILDALAVSAAGVYDVTRVCADAATGHNMRIVAYESGLDVWPRTFGFSDSLSVQVRFHPRMYDIYANYLSEWKRAGGTLINHYTFCDPMWGMMRWQDQDTGVSQTPIYLAALHFARSTPRWWTETRDTCTSLGAVQGPLSRTPAPGAAIRVTVRGGMPVVTLHGGAASAQLVDLYGRELRLARAQSQSAGAATMTAGRGVANGLYLVKARRSSAGAAMAGRVAVVE